MATTTSACGICSSQAMTEKQEPPLTQQQKPHTSPASQWRCKDALGGGREKAGNDLPHHDTHRIEYFYAY